MYFVRCVNQFSDDFFLFDEMIFYFGTLWIQTYILFKLYKLEPVWKVNKPNHSCVKSGVLPRVENCRTKRLQMRSYWRKWQRNWLKRTGSCNEKIGREAALCGRRQHVNVVFPHLRSVFQHWVEIISNVILHFSVFPHNYLFVKQKWTSVLIFHQHVRSDASANGYVLGLKKQKI